MRAIRPGSVVALALALAACSDLGPEASEVYRNQRLWERTRPASYEYAVERRCFCPPEYRGPVRMRVDGPTVLGLVYVDTGLPVPPRLAEAFPTVDEVFAILRAAFELGADEVRVDFDPRTGVPLDVRIDYDRNAADEELGFEVTEPVTAVAP